MSKYTMKLRDLIKMLELPNVYVSYKDIVSNGVPLLFNFDFPIFNGEHKAELEEKIVKRYYMREIGFETPEMFVFALDEKLNSIMPYYNSLYKTASLEYDILNPIYEEEKYTGEKSGDNSNTGNIKNTSSSNTNTTTTSTGKNESTSSNNGSEGKTSSLTTNNTVNTSTENNEHTLLSDLPQIRYTLANDKYSTDYGTNNENKTQTTSGTNTSNGTSSEKSDTTTQNATTSSGSNSDTSNSDSTVENASNTDNTSSGNYNENETYTRKRSGNNGSKTPMEMVAEYRQNIINIDNMVVEELAILFMNIY